MSEWKYATPIAYDLKTCKVFHGAYSPSPPLRVKETSQYDERDCIVIEFENDEKIASIMLGFSPKDMDTHTRLALKPSCARKLCCHLIEALADSGDSVANRIRHSMRRAMAELKSLQELEDEDVEE